MSAQSQEERIRKFLNLFCGMACLTLVCCCAAMHAPFAFRWGGSVDDWKFIIMDIIGIETGVSILVGRGPFAFESPHKELPSQ